MNAHIFAAGSEYIAWRCQLPLYVAPTKMLLGCRLLALAIIAGNLNRFDSWSSVRTLRVEYLQESEEQRPGTEIETSLKPPSLQFSGGSLSMKWPKSRLSPKGKEGGAVGKARTLNRQLQWDSTSLVESSDPQDLTGFSPAQSICDARWRISWCPRQKYLHLGSIW